MKKFYAVLFFSLTFSFLSAQNFRYVLAPSGLNLRETASTGSAKVTKVPYGGKVKLIEESYTGDLLVDNIPGGMAQVSYQGQTGYIFDGYLSQFPAPGPGDGAKENVSEYAEKVRDAGFDALVEIIDRDWGGYFQSEYAIELRSLNFYEAYVVARMLYSIPKQMHLPKPSKKDATIANPNKSQYAWQEDMTVSRDEKGSIKRINYYKRMEGGGTSVSIEPSQHDEAYLRISVVYIAD